MPEWEICYEEYVEQQSPDLQCDWCGQRTFQATEVFRGRLVLCPACAAALRQLALVPTV